MHGLRSQREPFMTKIDSFVLKLFSLITILFVALPAFSAGGISGGGGKGVLCGERLQALDIYEMESRGEQVSLPYDNFNDNLTYFIIKTIRYTERPDGEDISYNREEDLKKIMQYYPEIKKNLIDIKIKGSLPLTKDATVPKLRKGCKEVQVLIIGNDGKIYRDTNYWNQLDDTNKIAFIIHEFMYFKAKMNGAVDSDEARLTVGEILSNKSLAPIFPKELKKQKKIWCGAGGANPKQEIFELYLIEEQRNDRLGIGVYFFSIGNKSVLSRTDGFIEAATYADIFNGPSRRIIIPITNQLTGKQRLLEVKIEGRLAFRMKTKINDDSGEFSQGFCRIE